MATYTSKLNLKKPLGTELVSRSDMNDNYDKIDAGVVTNVDGEISNSLLIGVRASGSSVGARSIAIGGNVEASGSNSFACGNGAKASGSASHAEQSAIATGYHSHAENASTASGEGSHAENQSDAVGKYSHSENYSYAKGNYSHAEGYGTYAKGKGQHVGGKFNVYDPTGDYDEYGTYAEIIGNGTAAGSANRSNARALDWDGNEYLKGDLYVGCNADSTGGTKISDAFTGATSSVAGSVGLVPAPSAGDQDKFLAGDGTWKVQSGGSDMTGATASTAGTHGLVPAPAAGDQNKVLKGDGTWGEMDVSGKADKVASATSGNFAGLDSNGNLTDSGHKHSDYLTAHQDITGKADKVSGATSGNFAGLDSNGNLTDSGKSPSDLIELDADLEDSTKAAPADLVGQLALMKTDYIYVETEAEEIVSISDGAPLPVKKLTVDIDPVQEGSGDPSPENVRPISGWTEANVSRTGKNLLSNSVSSGTTMGVTFTVNPDRSVTVATDGTATGRANLFYSGELHLPPSNYYLSIGKAFATGQCYFELQIYRAATKTNFYGNTNGTSGLAFTLNEGDYIKQLYFSVFSGKAVNDTIYPQIEVGSTASTYEPYHGSTTEYEFPEAAGTVYGGTLTIHQDGSGELVVEYAKFDNPSSYDWVYDSSYANGLFRYRFVNNYKSNGKLVCSMYPYKGIYSEMTNNSCGYIFGNHFAIKDDSYNGDVSAFKSGIADMELIFELATPITYQLTNQQVLTLLKGNNVVFADCGSVSIEYPADTKLYIDGKVAELQALILENISNS